jgi:hypothetical protein
MARLDRIRLFCGTTRLFLRDLRKRRPDLPSGIPRETPARYLSSGRDSENSSFSLLGRTRPGERGKNLGTMARDIHSLIERYKGEPRVQGLETFRPLKRLFPEQCGITGGGEDGPEPPVQVKVKEPGDVPSCPLQDPSDPDATCSGHKARGHHLQIMETCSGTRCGDGGKPASLITFIRLGGAREHDGGAPPPAMDGAGDNGLKPETLLADTACGSDENVGQARPRGVAVISPAGGGDPLEDRMRLADFASDGGDGTVTCPEGRKAWEGHVTRTGTRVCAFGRRRCDECAGQGMCPKAFSGERQGSGSAGRPGVFQGGGNMRRRPGTAGNTACARA